MAFGRLLLLLALAVHVLADFQNEHQRHRNAKQLKSERHFPPNSRFRGSAPDSTKNAENADSSGSPTTNFQMLKEMVRLHDEKKNNGQDTVELVHPTVGNAKSMAKPRAPPVYLYIDQVGFIPRAKGVFCDFEPIDNGTNDLCLWSWNTTRTKPRLGFRVATPADVAALNDLRRSEEPSLTGPLTDGDNDPEGHFLYLPVDPGMEPMVVMSPMYQGLTEFCKFEAMLHQSAMLNGTIKLLAQSAISMIQWILFEVTGNNLEEWMSLQFTIGKIHQDINIMLEITRPSFVSSVKPLPHIAFDNIKMIDCQPEPAVFEGSCLNEQLKCVINNKSSCVKLQHICDLVTECDHGRDEKLNCDKMPFGSYCNFEHDDCGFYNIPQSILRWKRHTGPTPTEMTGPNYDHTCGDPHAIIDTTPVPLAPAHMVKEKCIGYYFFVNMNVTGPNNEKADFAMTATMATQVFNPPPKVHGNKASKYYNCCMIRFYYQQNGRNYGSLGVDLVEITNRGNITTSLWFSTKDKGEHWLRASIFLPNVTHRYYIEFWTRMGMRIFSDSAIDDFSMSPECFGLNIPKEELGDYNYYDLFPEEEQNTTPHPAFADKTYYQFNACGATGRYGPNQTMCNDAYKNTNTTVTVLDTQPQGGVQVWQVPAEGLYTIIAYGASGGYGSAWTGVSHGAQVRGLFELHKGEKIHMLIGQKGLDACKKTLSGQGHKSCERINTANSTQKFTSKMQEVRNTEVNDGGGGGGGGTFIYIMEKGNKPYPLLVAGGGGGISVGVFRDDGLQHGRGWTNSTPESGLMLGNPGQTAGAGGGWKPRAALATLAGTKPVMGRALIEGGMGGQACVGPAHGGFGGGGGGCLRGGGGGGWVGGNANQGDGHHGGGGWSYRDTVRTIKDFTAFTVSPKTGSGEVIIVPTLHECDCDYRCVALDEIRSNIQCYCPSTWLSDSRDTTKCILPVLADKTDDWPKGSMPLVIILSTSVLACAGAVLCICLYLYGSYQRKKEAEMRSKQQEIEQEIQLLRLRNDRRTGDQEMAINPHYGSEAVIVGQGMDFDGLPKVSRDRLTLIKALGQGAFGEVYEGLYKYRVGESDEMPVAVKTLPEVSSSQAESDFLMEAAIMAKFNHPNIVHLIGVCFDRHPSAKGRGFPRTPQEAGLPLLQYLLIYKKFIVLELLAGGDLKCFLRDSRPRATRPTSLSMQDLLHCAYDVAKGCRYMESKRFIHRDIAARNCLLTSRGPGRVAKIADFGMARDIYRSDYYKKGGKAMLPIKWMPPESFVDGIFTIKTDVWSYAVLLWEVFSLGVMPYPGCSNREVMLLVSGGGRLEKPYGCPKEIYTLMCECWSPTPEERPSFAEICDRIYRFVQDPEIINLPVPMLRALQPLNNPNAGHEEDDDEVDGVPPRPSNDYLVPLPSPSEPGPSPRPRARSTDRTSVHSTSSTGSQSQPPSPATLAICPSPAPSAASQGNGSARTSPLTNHQSNDDDGGSFTSGIQLPLQKIHTKCLQSNTTKSVDVIGNEDMKTVYLETSFSFDPTEIRAASPYSHAPSPVEKSAPKMPHAPKTPRTQCTPNNVPLTPKTPRTPRTPHTSYAPNQPCALYEMKAPLVLSSINAQKSIPSLSPPRYPWEKDETPNSPPPALPPKPLRLDAAQLEDNLSTLTCKRGPEHLQTLNVATPYLSVVTNSLCRAKSIHLDDQNKGNVVEFQNNTNDVDIQQRNYKLKHSSSAQNLLMGHLTDFRHADCDITSSSYASHSIKHITKNDQRQQSKQVKPKCSEINC